ncbi:MAG: DUF4417 domain-containing protein [Clostridia bacterium]|nr:DUF4417 domain-containing protein [Clostridia bacterium]
MTKKIKDVFHSYLVEDATYDGQQEIPRITTSSLIPEKIIPFSKARNKKEYDSWIHFYEHDSAFECFWNNPQKYLPFIKQYKGVISPDYSLYYDMPLCMQVWNTYRGKALAHWLQKNTVEVIPNIRWGDERTFEIACLGVETCKTIAVGTHGCIKTVKGKNMFIAGFDYVINKLKPKTILVYGRMPEKIFCLAKMQNIKLIPFESEFSLSHKKEVN